MEAADWDLQAVVRGCGGGVASRDPFSSFPPLLLQNGDRGGVEDKDMLFCFSNLLGTETSPPELEQLYKPFFPEPSPSSPQLPKEVPSWSPTPTTTPSSSAALVLDPTGGLGGGRTPEQLQQQRSPPSTTTTHSKRRNSQQNRVVRHVPADGLSCDMWAWRKYGQKPIKGSPYPRGYYRCSSSKGCLARKQVERCKTDPGVFVITYTAEHNHPVPTHRNSLAGSTRQKLHHTSSSSSTTTTPTIQKVNSPSGGVNRIGCSSLSPTTPLTSSMDEEPLVTPKKERREEVEEDEDGEEGMLLVSDIEMLGEDDVLFLGVDDVQQTSSDNHFQAPFPASQWMASSGTTMATGGV